MFITDALRVHSCLKMESNSLYMNALQFNSKATINTDNDYSCHIKAVPLV